MGRFRLFLGSFFDAVALTISENLGIVIAIHMVPVAAVDYSWTPQVVEPKFSHILKNKENELGNSINIEEPLLHLSFKKHSPKRKLMTLDEGFLKYGCSHYRRRCPIRTPCCSEIFDCHHCHEAKNNVYIDQKLRHDVPRHLIEKLHFEA